MEKFITNNNNIIVDTLGRFKVPATIPHLTFTIASTEFPPTGHSQRQLQFRTRVLPQTIYIDFDDGSPIFEQDFTSNLFTTNPNSPLKIYPNTSKKNVKIWFKYPEQISSIRIDGIVKWQFVDEFPLNIGLYNLDNLFINATNFSLFPEKLSGGKYLSLSLLSITQFEINYIPKWIYYSTINSLSLLGGFNLSNLIVSNFDKLINITGLQSLFFNNIKANIQNIPNNLKDISTLRLISCGNTPITEVPAQFNNCKQITELALGYRILNTSGANSTITAWGVGVANMPNLKTFSANLCVNIPTDLVTGLETSGVTNYSTHASYRTVARVDESIIKAYIKVAEIASKTVGNTVLRNIRWENGSSTSVWANSVPSGVFQAPVGFVLGSENGTPTTAMEAVYVLCKQYRWTIVVNINPTTAQTYNYQTV